MKKNILIIGAGGHSKVVYDLIKSTNEYNDVEFLDDKLESIKFDSNYKAVLGKIDLIKNNEIKQKFNYAFVGLGDSHLRSKIGKRLLDNGFILPNLKHPKAYIAKSAKLGIGNIFLVNSIIQAEVVINDFVIINNAASVDHDCEIGEAVHICPGVNIAGGVKIAKNTFIGLGSNIINNINIGENVIIGAGSLVINDIEKNSKVFGSPAKLIDNF